MGFASNRTFDLIAEDRLQWNNSRSVCREVDPALARVLPKQHAAQRGLTLRSLTHNLALVTPDEVVPIWNGGGRSVVRPNRDHDLLSILLLPWPIDLDPKAFHVLPIDDPSTPRPAVPFRYFAFRREGDPDALRGYVEGAIEQARKHARTIDFLVFPELALTESELAVAREVALREECLLVAGTALEQGSKLIDGLRGPGNVAVVDLRGWVRVKSDPDLQNVLFFPQRKHHRWCLDRSQIEQYRLTGLVPASKDCWEYADIGERKVQFWTIDSWLTFSVLICEDLARQDPVAQVIRAVGPNLVFALLMDGPQLRQRWSARYASVLAEDPGTSVLTLTSLGMSRLSRPREPGNPDRSSVIALWRDVENGEQEIDLPPDHDAMLLSVVCHRFEEHTCDGRGDGGVSYFPILSGVWPLASSRPPHLAPADRAPDNPIR
jgi:hypothetical protein